MRRRVGLVLAIAVLSTAAVSSGAPRPPAPQVLGAEAAPPPAWVESGGRASWLAYSGYCWDTPFLAEHPYCVAVAEPALCRHLPQVVARPGALLRFHFGFAPRQVTVIVRARHLRRQLAEAGQAHAAPRLPAAGAGGRRRLQLRHRHSLTTIRRR